MPKVAVMPRYGWMKKHCGLHQHGHREQKVIIIIATVFTRLTTAVVQQGQ